MKTDVSKTYVRSSKDYQLRHYRAEKRRILAELAYLNKDQRRLFDQLVDCDAQIRELEK